MRDQTRGSRLTEGMVMMGWPQGGQRDRWTQTKWREMLKEAPAGFAEGGDRRDAKKVIYKNAWS